MLLWRCALSHKDGLLFSAPPLTADAETEHLCVVLTYYFLPVLVHSQVRSTIEPTARRTSMGPFLSANAELEG